MYDVEALGIALGGFGRRGERELTLRADGVGCLRCGESKKSEPSVVLQGLEDEDALLQLEV